MSRVLRSLRGLHRDIGYFCVGMTLVYAISGIAVNHIHQWNPNFTRVRESVAVEKAPPIESEDFVPRLLAELGVKSAARGSFEAAPGVLHVFLSDGTLVEYDSSAQVATFDQFAPRTFLYELNFLHLNNPKKAWTWVSDLFAVLLGFLAVSGMFLVRGKNGFRRRGWVIVTAGLLVPLAFLVAYRT